VESLFRESLRGELSDEEKYTIGIFNASMGAGVRAHDITASRRRNDI